VSAGGETQKPAPDAQAAVATHESPEATPKGAATTPSQPQAEPDGGVAAAEEEPVFDEETPPPQDTPGAKLEAAAQSSESSPPDPQLGSSIKRATLKDAASELAAGKIESAIGTLYRVRQHAPKDARVALLLGHAYFRKTWRTDGLREYRNALTLRPTLRHDRQLIKNAVVALEDPTYAPAHSLIEKRIGAAALGELRTVGKTSKNPQLSRRAQKLALKLTPPKHWWQR
jgi:hypothetical protein